jgi:glycosyltransferase involved in cell wall biosynthesis
MAERGHHVEVVCPPIPWMQEMAADYGLTAHGVDLKSNLGLPAQAAVLRLVRSGRFDIVHAHLARAAYLGLVANALTGVPLVTTVHVETREPIYRLIGRGRNRIVAVSQYIRGVLKGRGVRGEAIDVVYNGTEIADDPPSAPDEVFTEFGVPRDRSLIGPVGRVAPEKGHHIALEALPRVLDDRPEAQLLFVGRTDGEFHERLRADAARLGVADRVTFTGHRQDVPRLLDAMDFSVLPTVMDGFGLAVIESMARERPVVASNVGALTELIEPNETGLLVPQTPEAFAEGMRFMLSRREERERMGRNAREAILARFTVDRMVDGVLAVYAKCLADSV